MNFEVIPAPIVTIVVAVIGSAVTIAVAIAGWMVVHRLTLAREIKSKQRETIVKFLIEAYQKLVSLAYDSKYGKQGKDEYLQRVGELQSVMLNIQLFGSSEQISLAKDILNGIANKSPIDFLPLLNKLRDDLRGELQLPEVKEELLFLL